MSLIRVSNFFVLTPEQEADLLKADEFAPWLYQFSKPVSSQFDECFKDEWWRADEGFHFELEIFPRSSFLWPSLDESSTRFADAAYCARTQKNCMCDVAKVFVLENGRQLAEIFVSETVSNFLPNYADIVRDSLPKGMRWELDHDVLNEKIETQIENYFQGWCADFLQQLLKWKAPTPQSQKRVNDQPKNDEGGQPPSDSTPTMT